MGKFFIIMIISLVLFYVMGFYAGFFIVLIVLCVCGLTWAAKVTWEDRGIIGKLQDIEEKLDKK